MSMDTSRGKEKEKEKERKARKARMMMAKEESQEMEKASQTMFNLRPHQLLPYRINKHNKLIILLLHQVLVMVSLLLEELNHYVLMLQRLSQHVLMSWHPRMQNKKYIDALVVEDRTNVMQQHSKTEEELKRFPVLVGDLDALRQGVQRRPARVPRQVGLQEGEASWKPLEKGTAWFSYGCSTEIEVPSHSEFFAETKESDEQQSAFSFHTVQTDLACEKGLAFHTENSAPPTVCILDLGCTRAMGSRRAVEAFCRYVDSHPNSGLWYEIQPTSSRFFFANSQQSKCTEKLVIFMYDHGWNTQFTEFDIVEEGDVPLLMSLPQMRNLGFQFELTPEKDCLSCARIGMRKMVLKTAISTHLILDLQDVAWYMSQVHFKTPQVKSFFSQHDHFEYSQIAVKQDVHEEEALVTGDYWQVDPLRRELIRHHKDKRNELYMR